MKEYLLNFVKSTLYGIVILIIILATQYFIEI